MPLANPKVSGALRAAGTTVGLTDESILVVGQMGDSVGTAVPGVLIENILNNNAWKGLFGPDTPLSLALSAMRKLNPETRIDVIPLRGDSTDTSHTATGSLQFSGIATEDGELTVTLGSAKSGSVKIPVATGDTAANIAAVVATEIFTLDAIIITPSITTPGTVNLKCTVAGTVGNFLGVSVDNLPGGITATISAMSGAVSAGNPNLSGVFDVVASRRYQGAVWQFESDLTTLTDFLDPRFNVVNDVLDGRGFVGIENTFPQLIDTLNVLNSQSLSVNVDKKVVATNYAAPAIFEIPFVKVAQFAAIRALRRTQGAVLGDLVISRSARDSFGGPWQNSKPYFNTPFPDLSIPKIGFSFSDVEIDQLRDAGGWVIDMNRAATEVIAGEVVTTYKTDSGGNPDPTFGPLNYVDTATAAREYIVNNTRAQYPQYRATGGQLIPGVDSANEASVAAFVSQLNTDLADLGLVNSGISTLDGNVVDYDKQFRENLSVTLNPVTGKFSVSAKLFIVVQLRDISYDLAVAFEI